MLQVRIHGRGGQGVVTATEMLAIAAFEQGRHAQALPSFGSERTGAPVVAFCRVGDQEIRLREPMVEPLCPDNAVIKLGPGNRFEFNHDYCKGCGVCVSECPCGAIDMINEDV